MKRTMSVIALVCLLAATTVNGAYAQDSVPIPEIPAPTEVENATADPAPPSIPVLLEEDTITAEDPDAPALAAEEEWTGEDTAKYLVEP